MEVSMAITRVFKPLEEKTREGLIEQIKRMQDRAHMQRATQNAVEKAYLTRLANYRKAKALANERADRAEAAMRAMLDNFGDIG